MEIKPLIQTWPIRTGDKNKKKEQQPESENNKDNKENRSDKDDDSPHIDEYA